jgi:hypothetical protein
VFIVFFFSRGVVCGWDLRPVMDVANWSGVRATAQREHQPFYTVLPDRTDLRQTENGTCVDPAAAGFVVFGLAVCRHSLCGRCVVRRQALRTSGTAPKKTWRS